MIVKNIIVEDMPFTKSIFEQFWRSYCKKTIFVVFHFLKFLPIYEAETDNNVDVVVAPIVIKSLILLIYLIYTNTHKIVIPHCGGT